MKFKKYNAPIEGSTTTVVVSGGRSYGDTVDLTEVYTEINGNTDAIAKNTSDISQLKEKVNNIDDTYIHKGGDEDDGTYKLGEVHTTTLTTPNYSTEPDGAKLTYDDNGNYYLKVRKLTDGTTSFSTLNGDTQTVTEAVIDKTIKLQYQGAKTIATTAENSRLVIDCGYNLTNTRYFNIKEAHLYVICDNDIQFSPSISTMTADEIKQIERTEYYSEAQKEYAEASGEAISEQTAEVVLYGQWTEVKDYSPLLRGRRYSVELTNDGVEHTYNLCFIVTYSYLYPTPETEEEEGDINLYIRGTDYTNSSTLLKGANQKNVTATSEEVKVMDGDNGYAIKADGIYTVNGDNYTKLI